MKFKKLIEALREHRPQTLLGVNLTEGDDASIRDRLSVAMEADIERTKLTMREAVRGTVKFREMAEVVALLEEIASLIADWRIEEAMALIIDHLARMAEANMPAADEPEPTPAAEPAALTEANKRLALLEGAQALREALDGSELPKISQDRVRDAARDRLMTPVQIANEISREKEFLSALRESGQVQGMGQPSIKVGAEQQDKWRDAFYAMLSGMREHNGTPAFRGLHESHRVIFNRPATPMQMAQDMMAGVHTSLPGELGVTAPKWGEDQNQYLREHAALIKGQAIALRMSVDTSTWSFIFGDSITRRLQDVFRTAGPNWRAIVSSVVPLADFRSNKRPRLGGFGDLPIVDEGKKYPILTDPGDVEEEYAAAKRGGLFDVTLEALANDDLLAIRTIPDRLGRAAARTLTKFVLNTLFSDNPLLDSDGLALFETGTHANLGVVALSATSLDAAITRLLRQTEQSSGEALGIQRPSVLIVPPELEKTAFELTQSPTDVTAAKTATVPNRFLRYGMTYEVNVHQTSAKNWQLVADIADANTLEVGFLDGMEEPALFLQDAENVGSRMSADKNTMKIRHIYGGTPLDFRGVDGSVVP